MSILRKLYGDFITVRNFFEVKKRILNLPKRTVYDPSKMMDLDIYGDLRTAEKIVVITHPFSSNTDNFLCVYLAERFHLHGYAVVAFNAPGFRNIVTDEPYTGEVKSQIKLGFIIDNIHSYIREENPHSPIVFSSFSAGGGSLTKYFFSRENSDAGLVLIGSMYNTPTYYTYLYIPTTLDISLLYAKNFIRTRNVRKFLKLLGTKVNNRRVYRINNNESTNLRKNIIPQIPIIGLHCVDDFVVRIEDARRFFSRLNLSAAKLIEFSGQGHSLTYSLIGTAIEQSDILCNNWIENKNKDKE